LIQFFDVKKIGCFCAVVERIRMRTLYLVPTTVEARGNYCAIIASYTAKPLKERDAGFDLITESTVVEAEAFGTSLNQQTAAAFYDHTLGSFRAFWLLPRSSLSKTRLRLSNSVGLIDAGYRGTLIAKVDNHDSESATITNSTRFFQIAAPDLLPFDDIQIVDVIPGGTTLRGSGGFGSTGLTLPGVPTANESNTVTYFGI